MDVPLFRLGRPGRPVLLSSVFRHDISYANIALVFRLVFLSIKLLVFVSVMFVSFCSYHKSKSVVLC